MTISRREFSKIAGCLLLSPEVIERSYAAGERDLWWKNAVAYEIYPRSFMDGNGDGIGDFPGMADRVDYLANLGINMIWVAACFDSPNADNGYDVRDYRKIMPDFGTMADFDLFLSRARKRGIHVILDMVFNHTSDEHAWFVESKKSRDNPFRDFYYWRDGRHGGPPNDWQSAFGDGSAWRYDEQTTQYYLHTFVAKQPDFKWENPSVRKELYSILKFWIEKGVSGFRFDAITSLVKPVGFENLDQLPGHRTGGFAEVGARLDGYLRDMHAQVFEGTALYTVGEAWGADAAEIEALTASRRRELNSAFRFDLQLADINGWRKLPAKLETMRSFNLNNAFNQDPDVWPVAYLEDHDFPRSVSRYGSAQPQYHERSAKLLATMLLGLRGTPYIYQGQEIGMTNFPFSGIDTYNDVAAHNGWHDNVLSGKVSSTEYLSNLSATTRDNARTPMQWNNKRHAGFTIAEKPWMGVNPNYVTINVARQEAESSSVLNHYRKMIRLRKKNPCLIYGNYTDLSKENSKIYSFKRQYGDVQLLVVLNFSDEVENFSIPDGFVIKEKLISNIDENTMPFPITRAFEVRPWEAMIYQLD